MTDLNLFDMFSDQMSLFGEEAPVKKEEEKKETPKPAEAPKAVTTAVSSDDSDDDFDDADGDEPITDKDEKKKEEAKKAAPKKKSTKSAVIKLTGPVTVIGTGFKYTYGIEGAKVTAGEAVKAAFAAGYKEVAKADITTDEKSTVFVNTLGQAATGENIAVGEVTTVVIGDVRVEISSDSLGCPADQASIDKVCDKFVELYPDFAGCSLKYDARQNIAFPVFHGGSQFKLKADETYRIYNAGNVVEAKGDAISKEEIIAYKSATDVVFLAYKAKKAVIGLDFELDAVQEKQIVEKWSVEGLEIYLETWGIHLNPTVEDFGGKDRVSKEDVVEFLKPNYSAFRSASRRFDFLFDKNSNRLGVAIVSGTKGAATYAAPFSLVKGGCDAQRVENTDIGCFVADRLSDGSVTNVNFTFGLPKIPYNILQTVIRYFKRDLSKEAMIQIYYDRAAGEYYIKTPEADTTKARVFYKLEHSSDILVATVHSHNTMRPVFSGIDDYDECYTGIFGVIGNLGKDGADIGFYCNFRAGMEGSFQDLQLCDLFGHGGDCA